MKKILNKILEIESMKAIKVTLVIISLTAALFNSGCLKNNPVQPVPNLSSSAELLTYFEKKGDYINSSAAPSIISATDVFNNLSKYYIIDIRKQSDFQLGHIEGAKNIPLKDLIVHLKSIDTSAYSRIVIVCETGQASAYGAGLMRLYGFNKVYSMNWGMASWHKDFSQVWLQAIKNVNYIGSFSFDNPPKNGFEELPTIQSTKSTTEEKLEERINLLLTEGLGPASIEIEDIMKTYDVNSKVITGFYVICYSTNSLYRIRDNGHPPGSVRYQPNDDLKSSKYLQTLPNSRRIAVYDYSGQVSAYAVAFMRLLGYNAQIILNGAHSMMGEDQWNKAGFFRASEIKNYPYVTGN